MPNLRQDLGVAWNKALEEAHHKEAIRPLPRLYGDKDGRRLRYSTPAIPTPSEIVRNDVVFLSAEMERTWAERVYVGLEQEKGDPLIQGFLHIRPEETLKALRAFEEADPKHPIPRLIESYLTCPPRLRPEQGKGHIIEDDLAAYLYGDPYVTRPVTPYCRPHRLFAGVCAHAATHMSLVLCSKQYGGRALGTFDIHRLACAGEGRFRRRTFGIRGLSPANVAEVFSSSSVGLNAIYDIRAVQDSYMGPGDACRCTLYERNAIAQALLGLIGSNCPVILAVLVDTWRKAMRRPPLREDGKEWEGRTHGIVLVGYWVDAEGGVTLIAHDSAESAFVTAECHETLEAAEGFDPGTATGRPSRVHAVAAVPQGVHLSPMQAGLEAWARSQPPRLWPGGRDEFLRSVSYRLISTQELPTAIADALGRPGTGVPATAEIQEELADQGIAYLWQVQPRANSTTTAFVAARLSARPPGLIFAGEAGEGVGCMVTVDPSRGICLIQAQDRGCDRWDQP